MCKACTVTVYIIKTWSLGRKRKHTLSSLPVQLPLDCRHDLVTILSWYLLCKKDCSIKNMGVQDLSRKLELLCLIQNFHPDFYAHTPQYQRLSNPHTLLINILTNTFKMEYQSYKISIHVIVYTQGNQIFTYPFVPSTYHGSLEA